LKCPAKKYEVQGLVKTVERGLYYKVNKEVMVSTKKLRDVKIIPEQKRHNLQKATLTLPFGCGPMYHAHELEVSQFWNDQLLHELLPANAP